MLIFESRFLFLIFSLTAFANPVFALEGFATQPGARASAMAGIFTAQADDSSAIWYNPAALVHYEFIKKDVTIELGQRVVSKSLSTEPSLNYFAAYARLPFSLNSKMPMGVGVSYFSPYKFNIHVDAPQSLVTEDIFGDIDATYHQVSTLLNLAVTPDFSLGGTLDFLWLNIDCLNYRPCVDYGPTAIGATFSGLFEVINTEQYIIKLGATWRSAADTSYRSTPSSGIGTVLTDFVPDRPDTKNFGINLQFPTPWALINSNITAERIAWSSTVKKGKSLADYQNFGASTEFLSLTQSGNSYAVRFGGKLLNNKSTGNFEVVTATVGAGYEVSKSHFVDIAYVYKKFRALNVDRGSWSLSYSWQ